LGYLADGDLFITGRKKDLIIKAGRNYYPAEIEEIASQAEGVRKGCVAAFGVDAVDRGTEILVIVAETSAVDENVLGEIRAKIVDKIVSQVGIPPDEVILVPPQTIPKTSSGKLRRSSCKTDYLAGKLGRRGSSTQTQIIKLFFQSRWKKLAAWLPNGFKILFNIYFFIILLFTVLPTVFGILILPQPKAEKTFRIWCRWLLRLCFCPMSIKGENYLQAEKPMIFVANHGSYSDILILAAVLPADSLFVAKRELLKVPLLKNIIKKLGHLTVDRFDFSKSAGDTQQIMQAIQQGRSVIIFPEGTFTYATGVRPFKSGAFKIATETMKPICPIAIKGARKILRAYAFLPQPAAIEITICEPLMPKATDWNEIVRLRDTSRVLIAKYCGEQTIDLVTAEVPTE
jgi:1-acyl-sn-glycerol-3-phosphate acyltransferase